VIDQHQHFLCYCERGGNPVQGDDGKWHLFVAEITNGCGLGYWKTNSQCIHATSNTVGGPYTKRDVALPVWAHSCRVVRDKTDGTWLLFHVGDAGATDPHAKQCPPSPPLDSEGGDKDKEEEELLMTRHTRLHNAAASKESSAWLHKATSPQGPWTPVQATNWSSIESQCGDPSPLQHPDGTWSLVCNQWPNDIFMATAANFSGPWSARHDLGSCVSKDQTNCPAAWPTTTADGRGPVIWEDQSHWIDARGNW
jgi:hypothetical protein